MSTDREERLIAACRADDADTVREYIGEYSGIFIFKLCTYKSYKVVELLLADPRIDVNERDNKGYSMLSYACYKEWESIVTILLESSRELTSTREITKG